MLCHVPTLGTTQLNSTLLAWDIGTPDLDLEDQAWRKVQDGMALSISLKCRLWSLALIRATLQCHAVAKLLWGRCHSYSQKSDDHKMFQHLWTCLLGTERVKDKGADGPKVVEHLLCVKPQAKSFTLFFFLNWRIKNTIKCTCFLYTVQRILKNVYSYVTITSIKIQDILNQSRKLLPIPFQSVPHLPRQSLL